MRYGLISRGWWTGVYIGVSNFGIEEGGDGVTRRNDAYGALDPRRGGCLV